MSEEDRLKGCFLFDALVAESLGGGGRSGAPLGGGCRVGITFPSIGLKVNEGAGSQCLINIRILFYSFLHTHTAFCWGNTISETCTLCYF